MPQTMFLVATDGPGLYEFTHRAADFVRSENQSDGLLTVFVRHTSCSLLIQENADPDVRRDLDSFFRRLVPQSDDPSMRWIVHTTEGPDDMPAHVRAALTQTSITLPFDHTGLRLGQWQAIYLYEHRDGVHERSIIAHVLGQGHAGN